MSEEKTEHKNAPSRRSSTATLSDLSKAFWLLDERIGYLGHQGDPFPDADVYDLGKCLDKIASTKDLAHQLSKRFRNPKIRETLIVLARLRSELELAHSKLGFAAAPSFSETPGDAEQTANDLAAMEKEVQSNLNEVYDKLLPAIKQTYHRDLITIAATLEADSLLPDEHIENEWAPEGTECKDFQKKTANEVLGLVLEAGSRAYFRKQVEAFDCKVKEHQAEMEQIKKDYEANPKLKAEAEEVIDRACAKGSNENPDVFDCVEGKGYLENFKNYIYYDNGNYWGPIAQTPDLVHYMTEFLDCPFPDNHKQLPNDDEKLICYYTLLAVVHDRFVSENTIFCEPYFFNSNGWPATLWRRIKQG
ncbi:MAG: hypothetical protein DRP56_01970, partial [Planctomycetota bacterium]